MKLSRAFLNPKKVFYTGSPRRNTIFLHEKYQKEIRTSFFGIFFIVLVFLNCFSPAAAAAAVVVAVVVAHSSTSPRTACAATLRKAPISRLV